MNVSKDKDSINDSVIRTIGCKSNVEKDKNQFLLLVKQDTERSRQNFYKFERMV